MYLLPFSMAASPTASASASHGAVAGSSSFLPLESVKNALPIKDEAMRSLKVKGSIRKD